MRPLRSPWILGLAVAAAALVVLIGINVVDEDMDPGAKAVYARPARPFSPESGWALMAGLHAPAGKDPRAYARAAKPQVRGARKVARVTDGDELAARAPRELQCSPESMDCVAAFAGKPATADEMAADNATLLARYDELLRARDLADVVRGLDAHDVHFPANLLLSAQRIRLSQVGAATARGRTEEALAWLEADAAFYRRWLEEAQTTLSKMLSARGYTRSVIMAGQVARSNAVSSPAHWAALERIAAPLTPAQRGIATAVLSEAVLFSEMLDEMIAAPRATSEVTDASRFMADVASRTLQRNATLNFAAPLYTAWIDLDGVEAAALGPAIARIRAAEARHLARDWKWAFNYPGRSVVAEGAYDVSEYIYRLRDADGLAATLRCVVALRRAGTPREAAAAFVASSPACADPYASAPLRWDAERAEVSFMAGWPRHLERLGGANGRIRFAAYAR